MPKKSRRAKAKHRARVAKTVQEAHVSQPKTMPAQLQSLASVPPRSQDLAGRYQYVIPEIKRIGIIAGAIIIVLIVLSFIGIPGW